jgi:N-acetylglucosaminyl-diphospho-decaprenol L-rhamnosyltransferase
MDSSIEKFKSENAFRATIIVLNYNGQQWLEKCLNSIKQQTIFNDLEVIVADNNSPDGSAGLAVELMSGWKNGRVVNNGGNLGFAAGNNIPSEQARGKYLFFLNNDAWLEPHCMENLLSECERNGIEAANPLVLNYADESFQSAGAQGFDCFGLPTARFETSHNREVLMPEGCGYLIQRNLFLSLGGFDPEFFMYAEEYDLSWRLWISGHRAQIVSTARMHHRGAAQVNPTGVEQTLEFRTSDKKRFYANRNCLLTLLKNSQHILFVLLLLQLLLLAVEMVAAMVIVRRWSFVKTAYLDAIRDCWRLRFHVLSQRAHIKKVRKRSDFWMLRFMRLRLNRWDEVLRMVRMGPPKISEK